MSAFRLECQVVAAVILDQVSQLVLVNLSGNLCIDCILQNFALKMIILRPWRILSKEVFN